MKQFLNKNKIFLIIFIFLIFTVLIYFLPKERIKNEVILKESSSKCQNIPDLPDNSIKLVTKVIDGDTFL